MTQAEFVCILPWWQSQATLGMNASDKILWNSENSELQTIRETSQINKIRDVSQAPQEACRALARARSP